jgi:hypothetical protein
VKAPWKFGMASLYSGMPDRGFRKYIAPYGHDLHVRAVSEMSMDVSDSPGHVYRSGGIDDRNSHFEKTRGTHLTLIVHSPSPCR